MPEGCEGKGSEHAIVNGKGSGIKSEISKIFAVSVSESPLALDLGSLLTFAF